MGLIYAEARLSNPRDGALAPLQVKAMVDAGAITLCIPRHVAVQLNLSELERREVTTADGTRRAVPYVGPVQVRFGNRSCFTGALVIGDSVLLGAIPLEDMDLVIDAARQRLTVNPDSPNIPSALVKSFVPVVPRSVCSRHRRRAYGDLPGRRRLPEVDQGKVDAALVLPMVSR